MLKIIILFLTITQSYATINEETLNKFNQWIKQYDIKINEYSLTTTLNNWIYNDNYINEVNSKNLSYKLGHNIYSGFSKSDFEDMKGYNINYNVVSNKNNGLRGNVDYVDGITIINNLKDNIDWRNQNVLTNIKTQGECGSSWAFSAISAIESAYAIKKNKLLSFSEQYLVDYDNILKGGYNRGCDGGTFKNSFKWIKNKSLVLTDDYEYVGKNYHKYKSCISKCNTVNDTTVIKYVLLQPNSDPVMMSALHKQPIAVSIDASTIDFYLYSSGIFTASCGINLNHAVNIVGYGSNKNGDYYIIRNSWGNSWGDNGYMYLSRDKKYNDGSGQCGILLEGAFPILN